MGDVTTNLLSISVSSPSSLYLRALSDWKAIKSLLLGCCQFSPRCNTTPGGPIGIASYFESNDCILIQIKDGAGASCRTSGFLPPRRRRRSVYGTLNLLESSRQVLGADLNRSESIERQADLYGHECPEGIMRLFSSPDLFAEFERAMIAERVRAGLARARSEGKRLGRPPIAPALEKRIREALATPGRPGVRVIAKRFGVDPGTVQRISRPFDRVGGLEG
jgi:hypothetical protein